jgi:hypothetical protein
MMLYTCEHNKCVVVYEKECPLCALEDELRDAKRDLERMGSSNNDMCDQIYEMEQRIKDLGYES